MRWLCRLGLPLVVLMFFIGCGGGGSTSQSMGTNDDFAALLNQVAGPEAMNVQKVVAVGGGSIDGIFHPINEEPRNATFSFFAGGDKNCDFFDPDNECDFRGNFVFSRKDIQTGTRGILSTAITKVVVYEDYPEDDYGNYGRCVVMTGIGDFKADWNNPTAPRQPDRPFTLIACDNDGLDTVWWEVPTNAGGTLSYAIELKGGNIMVRLPL